MRYPSSTAPETEAKEEVGEGEGQHPIILHDSGKYPPPPPPLYRQVLAISTTRGGEGVVLSCTKA